MLFAAALSLFLSSGSSLAVATPISNTTLRGCGTTPSKEVIAQAEARFARSKKVAINFSDPGITIPPIPVYCMLVLFLFLFYRGEADAGLLPRACGPQ